MDERQTITLAQDKRTGQPIDLTVHAARTIFVSGKRGSGKTYTLGRIVEEIHALGRHLIVVVDPLAQFWATGISRPDQAPVPTREIVPGDPQQVLGSLRVAAMQRYGIEVARLWLNPSDLSPAAWCSLFEYKLAEPQGIALYRAVRSLRGRPFIIADILAALMEDELAGERTQQAVANRLMMAEDWGLFSASRRSMLDVLKPGHVNVIDVATFDPGPQSIRNLVAKLLVEQLFRARLDARFAEALGEPVDFPPVFLAIDEAHDFCPAYSDALAKRALIRFAKEGRQPGLSLALATQQPSALSFELISQCDALVIHRLTLHDDVKTVDRLASTYAADLPAYLKGIRRPGEAIIVDDAAERVAVGQILPRRGRHLGGEALRTAAPLAGVLAG